LAGSDDLLLEVELYDESRAYSDPVDAGELAATPVSISYLQRSRVETLAVLNKSTEHLM
jgi:hypothetical protein